MKLFLVSVLFFLQTLIIQAGAQTLPASSTINVVKNGIGLCNSVSFSQLPDQRNFFIGRVLLNTTNDKCSGSSWQLGLFKMDWTSNTLNFQKLLLPTPASVKHLGVTIVTAYDASVVKYNGEYWAAFECGGTGQLLKTLVSACLAPFTLEKGVDLSRMTIPVIGSVLTGSTDSYSASVPKLLVFNGNLYLYWTVVRFKILNGVNKFYNLTTRGIQLVQELTQAKKIWGVKSNNAAIGSMSSLSQEVLGLNQLDSLSNNVADGFQVMAVNNKIIMTAAIGGVGCINPLSPLYGCYRMQIFQSTKPLGNKVFNSSIAKFPVLPFNPHEYGKFYTHPNGKTFIMGMFIEPSLVGSPRPLNTLPVGLKSFPFDLNSMLFTTNTTSVTPKPVPVNKVETVHLATEVLENFLNACAPAQPASNSCRAAIKRYCVTQGYGSGGYGPTDISGTHSIFSCINSSISKLVVIPLSSLKKYQPACNGQLSDVCNSAIGRHCASIGFAEGGFGPSEFDGANVAITCLKAPNAKKFHTTISKLKSYRSGCESSDVNSVSCSSAANQFCISLSYKSTYGVQDHAGPNVVVGCMK